MFFIRLPLTRERYLTTNAFARTCEIFALFLSLHSLIGGRVEGGVKPHARYYGKGVKLCSHNQINRDLILIGIYNIPFTYIFPFPV